MEPREEKAATPLISWDKCKLKTASGRKQGLLVNAALCELNCIEGSVCERVYVYVCVCDCAQIQYQQLCVYGLVHTAEKKCHSNKWTLQLWNRGQWSVWHLNTYNIAQELCANHKRFNVMWGRQSDCDWITFSVNIVDETLELQFSQCTLH